MKRLSAITMAVVALAMLLSVTCFAGTFADVDETTVQGAAIERLAGRGIVDGIGGGYFAPEGLLTRAQFVKIVNNVFGYTHAGENKFSDVSEDAWYYSDVCIAAEAGYINGIGDGLFAPENVVTREQACVILNNILGMDIIPYYTEPSDAVSPWARDSVILAVSNRLISLEEGNRLRATEPMKRGEACEMLEKCLLDDVAEVQKIDMHTIAAEELEMRMNRVIAAMENQVIPELENEECIKVAYMIIENMQAYLSDRNHDYETASKETFKAYAAIPKEERQELKLKTQEYNKLEDMALLYNFFFMAE